MFSRSVDNMTFAVAGYGCNSREEQHAHLMIVHQGKNYCNVH